MAERRDSKNRKLRKGEYQRTDGRYAYRYVDYDGKERWVYSWRLVSTDPVPEGKSDDICLRDLEIKITKATADSIDIYSADRMALNRCFEDYIVMKTDLKEQTRIHYQKIWKWYLEDGLGKRPIGSIRYSDILKLYSGMIDSDGLSQGTVRNVNLILHPVFEIAVRDGLLRVNPTNGALSAVVKNRKADIFKEEKALTEDQQRTFLEFLKSDYKYRRWYRLTVFLLGTGCRIGEARGLIWDDCDFTNKLISIKRQLVYYKGKNDDVYREHVVSPKSSSGTRIVPMFESVREVLLEQLYWQDRMGLKSETIDGVSGFIFVRRTGTCMDDGSVTSALKRLAEHCNEWEMEKSEREFRDPILLPSFSAHDLRHTFCTRMCENEGNLKVIQEVMGHADISVTMNIYSEVTKAAKLRSFEALEGKIV